MKKIKNIQIYTMILVALVSTFFVSCEGEEGTGVVIADVTNMVPLGDTEILNAGLPGELIRVEGSNIDQTRGIVFDGKVDVIFNPALNSDVALFFNVPFDASRGSRFGSQELTFIDRNGNSYSKEFNLLQPEPLINSNNQYEPEKAVGGEDLLVRGQWFVDVTDVAVNGVSVGDFTVISDTELSFIFPEGATEAVELTITTVAGSVSRDLPIEGGFVTRLVTDFDGNGPLQGGWVGYGDHKFELAAGLGVDGSIGGEIVWDGTGSNGFTGCTSEGAFTPVTTGTDAENAFILIDVNANGYPGTVFEFTLTDETSETWLAKATPVEPGSGWQTLEVKIADFGFGYDPSNQGNGDPNPSTIVKINVQISQEGGAAPVPSGYKFDNLRIKALEE